MSKKVIIIGAGVGGLAAACVLSQAGYNVSVYEKNTRPGGRLGEFEAAGFTFTEGPSWYLMPDVYEHFFELIGEDITKHLKLQRLSPSYRVFFKDSLLGATDMHSDLSKDGRTFESLEPGSRTSLTDYMERARHEYEVSKAKFLYKNYDSWRDFLSIELIRESFKVRLFASMERHVEQHFKSKELQKIMLYTTTFLGARPSETPALYNIMSHVDLEQGVYYPEGGMYRIVEVLIGLAEARGVTIHLDSPVEKIITADGLATGVSVHGQKVRAEIVISNTDLHHTEHQLLDKEERMYTERFWRKATLAPSALALYLGVRGEYPELQHHNLVFSKDWGRHFDAIFKKKRWPKDPSFYVCNASKTDKTVAPEAHENLFVLVPIAPGLRYTSDLIEHYTDSILKTMEQTMHLKDLRQNIVYKKVFTVQDFEQQYNAYKGSALGLAHTLKQTAVFRPKNTHKKIQNLYFVGANTVPGIGLPMCLISAELVYKRLIGDNSREQLKKLVS